jgi:hypothetical protein
MKTIICFDLDGVICSTKKNYYYLSRPIKKNIKKINILFNKGFIIAVSVVLIVVDCGKNILGVVTVGTDPTSFNTGPSYFISLSSWLRISSTSSSSSSSSSNWNRNRF